MTLTYPWVSSLQASTSPHEPSTESSSTVSMSEKVVSKRYRPDVSTVKEAAMSCAFESSSKAQEGW